MGNAEMAIEEEGEEGISDAVLAQMAAKSKELSKKRYQSSNFFFLSFF